jgi:hypothetical protein
MNNAKSQGPSTRPLRREEVQPEGAPEADVQAPSFGADDEGRLDPLDHSEANGNGVADYSQEAAAGDPDEWVVDLRGRIQRKQTTLIQRVPRLRPLFSGPALLLFVLLVLLVAGAFYAYPHVTKWFASLQVDTGAPSIPGSASRTFPETGMAVGGVFLDYWRNNGGLPQQGFPISELMKETSDLDGKAYVVQYFERAVFQYSPEQSDPRFQVLLSQLGTFQYRKKYPDGAPGQQPSAQNPRLFPDTGKTLGGLFREYWEKNGGLAQQGLPISDEFVERSDLDGNEYLVQYFERAVMEYHPENQPPYDVLLSQLGTFQYKAKYGSR